MALAAPSREGAMEKQQAFAEDALELLREGLASGRIDRRAFLRVCAVLGATAPLALRSGPAAAQAKEIVLSNAGGDAASAMQKVFAETYMKANPGTKVVVDGTFPSSAKIKAMVDANHVTWDVCDRNLPAALELGQQGLLAEIDYGIVDKKKMRPEHAGKWGAGSYIFSNVLCYQTGAFGGRKPMTWKDFWNVKDFPGKRALRKHIDGQLEAALLADGVEPSKLYPLDLGRALDKIKELKPHCIFWSTGAESQQLLRDREVVMANVWNTRASVLRRESGKKIDFHYNEAPLWVAAWIVPKGNPAGKDVFRLIASTQDPGKQVELFKLLGNGPVNPAASAMVPDDLKVIDPSSPANYKIQIPVDPEWYAKHSATALQRYIEAVS
jgi:putative spermidine/putrescine transport system substrate-binding protein